MKIALALLLLALSLGARAAETIVVLPGLTVERIPERLTAPIDWPARSEIIVAPGQVWLLAQNNIWRLGAAHGLFAAPVAVESFARSDAGTLAAIVGGKLGLVSRGMFLPAIATPEPAMRLVGGPRDTLYLHGTRAPARILGFDGEQVAVLATVAEAVTALTHLGDTVIFASAEGIFSLRPGQPPGLLFPLAGHALMISLAVNVDTAELFGATEDAIYQIDEGRMTQIAQGLGGALALVGKDILVADVRRQSVFRVRARGGD
jgi:hypothetical protein